MQNEGAQAMQMVKDLKHDLYGNGQPGDIQRIDGRIDQVKKSVQQLNDFKIKMIAYGTAIAFVVGILTGDGELSLKKWLGH